MDRFIIRTPRKPPSEHKATPETRSEVDGPSEQHAERPAKKRRLKGEDESGSIADGSNDVASVVSADDGEDVVEPKLHDDDSIGGGVESFSLTPLESAMAAGANPKTKEDAIAAYEALRTPQEDEGVHKPSWVPGESSIYVDAFNLALDTVLEDEAYLFSAHELEVFAQWRGLDYEAQYLYVRLFLRKTALWHRIGRLGYSTDVKDLDAAIERLQKERPLPTESTSDYGSGVEEETLLSSNMTGSFTFADGSATLLADLNEAASLLSLDELKVFAKEAKVQGRNKPEIIKAICRMGQQQTSLMGVGITRGRGKTPDETKQPSLVRHESNRTLHFLSKILAIAGPCVRLTPLTFALFERVHLVFYRSTEWTEKSLRTIILAKISRHNFYPYLVCRTNNIFPSRQHLLEYEAALKVEGEVDAVLELGGPPGSVGLRKVVEMLEGIYPRWRTLLEEEGVKERTVYADGEEPYLRRFMAGHSYTRVVHKAAYALGRLKDHAREHKLLCELLGQRLFHPARRGSWYQRKALLEENYMHELGAGTAWSLSKERQKKHGREVAAATCEAGLQDNDCHLIHHYDLQKRLVKLEKRIGIPPRNRHDFGHVKLRAPIEHTVEGIQIKRKGVVHPGRAAASTRTIWIDELNDGAECSVEDMCLGWYKHHQGWNGHHAEGGVVRTLFALLFFDVIFLPLPNVFQTAFQTCPLDLHTDAFYAARMPEINRRLAKISNGAAEGLIREVHGREHGRRTAVVGLDWDYDVEDLAGLARGLGGPALATVCRVLAQEYKHRGGGMPDLVLWRDGHDCDGSSEAMPEAMFAEVKSKGDRLSDTQRLWIHVLTGAGVTVALCHAVAREVREPPRGVLAKMAPCREEG